MILQPDSEIGGQHQVFVDDSNSSECPYYVLAGWVDLVDAWVKFSAEWRGVLEETPSVSFFRANCATALKEQFKGWSEESVDRKVSNLAQIISRRRPFGIAAYVNRRVFAEHIAVISKKTHRDPYFICALGIVSLCQRLFNKVDKIDFIFDKHGKTGKRFKEFYDSSVSRRRISWLGEMRLLDDKEVMRLQASDMYASFVRYTLSSVHLTKASDGCLSVPSAFWLEIRPAFMYQLADRLNRWRDGARISLAGM